MKPPICELCGKRFIHEAEKAGLVQFALTEEDEQFNQRFKEPGFVGHPRGLAWFCAEHYQKAIALKGLTLAKALQELIQPDE